MPVVSWFMKHDLTKELNGFVWVGPEMGGPKLPIQWEK
jgi:hypothetical protein